MLHRIVPPQTIICVRQSVLALGIAAPAAQRNRPMRERKHQMKIRANVGYADRVIRIVIGLVLIAYALRLGFADTGWNWVGWIGVMPIATAIIRFCPAYTIMGIRTGL
jgi:hypothetical protein